MSPGACIVRAGFQGPQVLVGVVTALERGPAAHLPGQIDGLRDLGLTGTGAKRFGDVVVDAAIATDGCGYPEIEQGLGLGAEQAHHEGIPLHWPAP